jgi:general secretion pathway protein K
MKTRHGFVLIAALWLLVALGAVGLDAALRSRTRRLAAANLLDETRARAAALAGTEYARSRLTAAMLDRAEELRAQAQRAATNARGQRQARSRNMNQLFRNANPADDPWRMPDQLVMPDMAFGDAQYALRVRDTGAALNLNEASEQVLRDFFARGLRVDAAAADHLAQAILDWRDEDENPRINGGERDQYLKEDAVVLPPNRDFAELDELRYVMGMTPELYEAALPYLTLVGSGDININAAPEPVLLALPGLTDAGVTQLIRLRESGQFPRNEDDLQAMLGNLARNVTSETFEDMTTYSTNEVEIISEGAVTGSPMRVRARVVVSRSNSGAVVVWRRID